MNEMEIDTQLIGSTAAELMETIGDRLNADWEVDTVIVVVSARWSGGDATSVHFQCSDARPWLQRGLLMEALDTCRGAITNPDDDEGEE